VVGRGGTDLRPVFEPAFLREHQPDGIVYFTDGCGPYPMEDPGIKTLWVLTSGPRFGCTWGERVVMKTGGRGTLRDTAGLLDGLLKGWDRRNPRWLVSQRTCY
jgi:predicted metal-dependent peptidase